MDIIPRKSYNKRKGMRGVICLAQSQSVLVKNSATDQKKDNHLDVMAIRKKLAVSTLPGISLIDLYKEGK